MLETDDSLGLLLAWGGIGGYGVVIFLSLLGLLDYHCLWVKDGWS